MGCKFYFKKVLKKVSIKGLGILKGNIDRIDKFSVNKKLLKIPHVTWSKLELDLKNNCSILNNVKLNQMVYFVHSYCVDKNSLVNKDIVKALLIIRMLK